MNLHDFLMENVSAAEEQKVFVSKRFKKPFTIKAITEAENQELKKSCQKRVKQKNGTYTYEMDQEKYMTKLASACTVTPDFKHADLQKSWGVLGEESLINKMLLPGEYTTLMLEIQEICGFDADVDQLKEEVKK